MQTALFKVQYNYTLVRAVRGILLNFGQKKPAVSGGGLTNVRIMILACEDS